MSVLYGLPSENVAALATIVATTEDPAYPAANLADLSPTKPSKLLGTTGQWVLDFGAPQRVDLVALWHHNLDAGQVVDIEGNDANTWSTPLLEATLAIPDLPLDGYPLCPFADLSALMTGSPAGYRYYRLSVATPNSVPVAIGDLWMAAVKRDLGRALQWGLEEGEDHPVVEHVSEFQVGTVYDLGVRLRTIRAKGYAETGLLEPALQAWRRDTRGRAKASLFIPDSAVNDALFIRFGAGGLALTKLGPALSSFDFVANEIGRGLPL